MTWLQLPELPEQPETHELMDGVELRVDVGGTTNDRWRRIYNDLAAAAEIPAVALGTENRTVLLIRVPITTPAEDVAPLLEKAEQLLEKADWAFKAEGDQLWNVGGAIKTWCSKRANSLR
ncbi:MAG: hypothetical protein ACLQRM_07895 [Acidimicrobiales bacterium]